MKTKVKVSKKAVGVFVVSLTILLLLVFVTAPASKASMSTQCAITPVQSIATGTDTPTNTPMDPVPFPNLTGMPWGVFTPTTGGGASPPIGTPGMPWGVFTPTTGGGASPPIGTPVTPAVVSGGGMPWGYAGPTHIPHLPVSSPIPQGQWSPFVTPQNGGPAPSPVACDIMGEESALSANITIPVPETDDMEEEDEDEEGDISTATQAENILALWTRLRQQGLMAQDPLYRLGADGRATIRLMDAEINRVARIMAQTTGYTSKSDYSDIYNYLSEFQWDLTLEEGFRPVQLELGDDDLIVMAR